MIVDHKPHIRPCVSIPSDGNEGNDWIASISEMYAPLTTHLPLAGASAIGQARGGSEPWIAAALRSEAPWMQPAIDRIAEQAAMQLWAGQPWLLVRPLLLVGPSGAGKTHFARALGKLSGCGDAILSFAGVSNNAELAGNPRGFRHPLPCLPATAMLQTGTANPVIVIDEIDKAAAGELGDPVATLLGLTERSTARRYFDGCLAAEIDLSHINWVMTANSIARVPSPLLSRVDVVEVAGPGPEHAELVLASLWQAVAHDLGLPPMALPSIEKPAEAMLLRLFRNTRSVRRLRRTIETLVAVSVRHTPRTIN